MGLSEVEICVNLHVCKTGSILSITLLPLLLSIIINPQEQIFLPTCATDFSLTIFLIGTRVHVRVSPHDVHSGPDSIGKKSFTTFCPKSFQTPQKYYKRGLSSFIAVHAGILFKNDLRYDFRQDFLSVELAPWF